MLAGKSLGTLNVIKNPKDIQFFHVIILPLIMIIGEFTLNSYIKLTTNVICFTIIYKIYEFCTILFYQIISRFIFNTNKHYQINMLSFDIYFNLMTTI